MSDLLVCHDEQFVDFAGTITADEWQQPSLCAGWSNHDVLSHLVLGYQPSILSLSGRMIAQRGSFDRANSDLTRRLSRRADPTELIAEFDRLRFRRRGFARLLPARLLLGDHVVHQLDIALAIGRDPVIDLDAARAVLHTEVTIPNPFVPARRNAKRLSLGATDIAWQREVKGGIEVVGRAAHLISVLAGRAHALDELKGAGVAVLRTRLTG